MKEKTKEIEKDEWNWISYEGENFYLNTKNHLAMEEQTNKLLIKCLNFIFITMILWSIILIFPEIAAATELKLKKKLPYVDDVYKSLSKNKPISLEKLLKLNSRFDELVIPNFSEKVLNLDYLELLKFFKENASIAKGYPTQAQMINAVNKSRICKNLDDFLVLRPVMAYLEQPRLKLIRKIGIIGGINIGNKLFNGLAEKKNEIKK